jgi:hypothetical protein
VGRRIDIQIIDQGTLNWEGKLFCLLTIALMGDPFTFMIVISERTVKSESRSRWSRAAFLLPTKGAEIALLKMGA